MARKRQPREIGFERGQTRFGTTQRSARVRTVSHPLFAFTCRHTRGTRQNSGQTVSSGSRISRPSDAALNVNT